MHSDCEYGLYMRRKRMDMVFADLCRSSIPRIHALRIAHCQRTPALDAVRYWDWKQKPFLALLGEKGVGKSFAASYAYLRYVLSLCRSDDWKNPGTWKELSDLAVSSLCWMHIFKIVNDREAVEQAVNSRFLIIDDLATEDATSQAKSRVNYIISSKYDQQRPMIITGNMSISDFNERYGERIYERIMQCGQIEVCEGKNLRYE